MAAFTGGPWRRDVVIKYRIVYSTDYGPPFASVDTDDLGRHMRSVFSERSVMFEVLVGELHRRRRPSE